MPTGQPLSADRRNNDMKENNENQVKGIYLPPAWCGAICRNAMNEACIEHCAIERDCSSFEIKPALKIEDMPRFPDTKGMTKEERFTCVVVYLTKVVDHAKGVDDEYVYLTRRSHLDRPRSRTVLEDLQGKDLLSCFQEGDPAPEDREKREDPADGSPEVVGEASNAA